MTRLGWAILALIAIVAAGFVSLTSFGTANRAGPGRSEQDVPDREAADRSGTPGTLPVAVLTVPVAGYPRGAITDNWGDARGGGSRRHHGTDIMAPGGATVVAAAPGRVEKLFESELGGTTLYLRSADRRWIYYYAHLSGYAPGVVEGMRVRAGQALGYVGDTGDAGPGNYHLHFGMQRMQAGQRWYQGEDVDPYRWLTGRVADRPALAASEAGR